MPVPHSEDLRVFHFHIAPFSSSPSHTQWVSSSRFDFHISALWLSNTTINISVWPENWFVFGMYGFEMVCSIFRYFVGPSGPWSLRKIMIVIKINIGLRCRNYFEAVKTSILIQNINMYREIVWTGIHGFCAIPSLAATYIYSPTVSLDG